MERPWKIVVAFVLVFIAGAVFGGVFTVGVSARRNAGGNRANRTAAAPTGAVAASPARGKSGGESGAKASTLTPTLMRQFTGRLNLSPEQKERITPIVSRASDDFVRFRQENLADTARVTERMYADVSAALNPAQRGELETMRRQMQERVQNERRKRAEGWGDEAPNRSATP
jgi:hypothetical protein